MDPITKKLNVDHLIQLALQEDISSEDVTTNAVMPDAKPGEVELLCKEDGIIAGLEIFERVFKLLDENTEVTFFAKDGDEVKVGQKLAVVRGDIRVLLSGERTALNYLQRMSGIATYTHSVAELLKWGNNTVGQQPGNNYTEWVGRRVSFCLYPSPISPKRELSLKKEKRGQWPASSDYWGTAAQRQAY